MDFEQTFTNVVVYILPYVVIWRLGTAIVRFLLDCILGGRSDGRGLL